MWPIDETVPNNGECTGHRLGKEQQTMTRRHVSLPFISNGTLTLCMTTPMFESSPDKGQQNFCWHLRPSTVISPSQDPFVCYRRQIACFHACFGCIPGHCTKSSRSQMFPLKHTHACLLLLPDLWRRRQLVRKARHGRRMKTDTTHVARTEVTLERCTKHNRLPQCVFFPGLFYVDVHAQEVQRPLVQVVSPFVITA